MNCTSNQTLEAWVRLMERYPFHHFATLTSKQPLTPWQFQRERGRYIRRIERQGYGRPWWFSSMETGRLERLHMHMLLGGTKRLPSYRLEDLWWRGIAKVKVFDPELGARAYIAKDVPAGLAEIELPSGIERSLRRQQRHLSD